jgi:hypothetical protein
MVHDTVYLGEFAQHEVNVSANGAAADPLKVFELNPRLVARDETVQKARIWFDPADVTLLTE